MKKNPQRSRLEQLLALDRAAQLEARRPPRYPKIKGQKYVCSACDAVMFFKFLKCPQCEKGTGVIRNDNAHNPDKAQ